MPGGGGAWPNVTGVRRDFVFVAFSVPLLAIAAFLVTHADFSATPVDSDVTPHQTGCLDWWCRGQDLFLVGFSAALIVFAIGTFWWGIRKRER